MDILTSVAKKLAAGERLSDADALALFECADITAIGQLADEANRAKNDDAVFYNVNRHINPTNICALSCKFCAYSRKIGEEGAYAYSIDEMVTKAREAVAQGATEVHMVGGLHPRWRFDHYKEMIAAVKGAFPDLHIKAFTAVELDWLARKARKTISEVLQELREVGLGSLPGGGAEIFHPEIRDQICDTKVSAEQWLDTHRTAHGLGMHSNCTMLYGHIETYAHRVDHMRRLRDLQDETRGFNAFIPLSFQPFQNEMGIDRYTFGFDDLKTLAVARLYLDNFKHIKAYWIMLGQDIAQLALHFGANDVDGTVLEEKISRAAGGRAGMAMGRSFLEGLIQKAKRRPVERDTLYHPVIRPDAAKSPLAAYLPFDAAATEGVLARASSGDELSHDDLLLLATRAPLNHLGSAATARQASRHEYPEHGTYTPVLEYSLFAPASAGELVTQIEADITACRDKYKLAPTTLALILDDGAAEKSGVEGPDTAELLERLWALRHSFPAQEIALWGLKGLWRFAQDEDVSITALVRRLAEAGVDVVESAPNETETDLTHGEIIELHQAVHAAGVPTVAKVELTAPAQGAGEPQWDSFLKRVAALSDLGRGPESSIMALSVEVSSGSFVTPTEYMRAVALCRLAADGIQHVLAPLARLPTISPAQGIGTQYYQHPAEKVAALALHYGASDLGPIDVRKVSPVQTMKQIRAAGHLPGLRDVRLANHQKPAAVSFDSEDLRHVPELDARSLSL